MSKTIFLDIDGTLIRQDSTVAQQIIHNELKYEALPGVVKKLQEWESKGYRIILTTGRRECWRELTEHQLQKCGIWYDQLIMGIGSGPRFLINDLKPFEPEKEMASAINLPRNKGIAELEL